MFPNMYFPAYNNADYIEQLSKFTFLLRIHESILHLINSIIDLGSLSSILVKLTDDYMGLI